MRTPGGWTCAAPWCSARASCAAVRDLAGERVGVGQRATLGLIAAGVAILAVLGGAGAAHAPPLADIEAARRARRCDDQPRDAVRRLRDVRLVPADPAARGGAGVDGLRLRPRRHRRGPADAARLAGDARRRAAVGRLGGRYGSKLPLALGGVITSVGLLLLGLAHGTRRRCSAGRRDVGRDRLRVRRDAEPDRGGRAAEPDRGGDRLQRARALGRLLARRADRAAILAGSPVAGAPYRPTAATPPRSSSARASRCRPGWSRWIRPRAAGPDRPSAVAARRGGGREPRGGPRADHAPTPSATARAWSRPRRRCSPSAGSRRASLRSPRGPASARRRSTAPSRPRST